VNTEVKILGKSYSVRSEHSEAFMVETANFLNGKMRELMTKSGTVATEKIAILTAMNLAGEFLKLKKDEAFVRTTLKEKGQKLLKLIDSQL